MIKLNQIERNFLIHILELKEVDKTTLKNSLSIDDDFADRLRDLCLDKLDLCGFDENYEPTDIGKELNKLIDKLFIG